MIGNLIRAAMQQRIAQQNAQPRMMQNTMPGQGGFGRLMRGARDWGSFLGRMGLGTITSPLQAGGLLQRRAGPWDIMNGQLPTGQPLSEYDRMERDRLASTPWYTHRMQWGMRNTINENNPPPAVSPETMPTGGIPTGRTGVPSGGGAGGGYSGRSLTPTGLFNRKRRGIVTVGPIPDDEEN